MPEVRTLHTQLTTPDGTILVSRNRHNFVSYTDTVNNKVYFIDGGTDYLRCSFNGDEVIRTITSEDPYELIRQYICWGSYGKNEDEELHYIKLKDLSDEHLEALLGYVGTEQYIYRYLVMEKEFRHSGQG